MHHRGTKGGGGGRGRGGDLGRCRRVRGQRNVTRSYLLLSGQAGTRSALSATFSASLVAQNVGLCVLTLCPHASPDANIIMVYFFTAFSPFSVSMPHSSSGQSPTSNNAFTGPVTVTVNGYWGPVHVSF